MDKDSLLEVLSLKSNYISKLLRVMGVGEDDVEDLRNDVLENAVRRITTLRDEGSIEAWLRTLTMRRASKYFSKRRHGRELSNIIKMETG